ncbi:MAG TPA: enoyl-CoA hydratase/isomerase family protein [Candidatus Binataceae bacterium]|jgi:enoyl-CoA hydratase|nr:enoyl-CoA hydratase/isomerase family protein [Candidatus Binataceae bacterium]
MSNYFKLDKSDSVALLTFDRNEKRNPLNQDSVAELEANLLAIRDDHEIRALTITGVGNTFSAGADLSHMKGVADPAERQRLFTSIAPERRRILRRTLALLQNLEIPTVAAVNGFAVGGGWFLALACDLRIAVEGAEFWMPEVDLGSPGPRGPEQWLAQHVGPARAKEIIFTCRHFKADELLQWGLLNRVVKKTDLMPTALELARSLAAKRPDAIRQAKAQINGYFLE